MFSKRSDAFEDIEAQEDARYREKYQHARELLAEQAAELIGSDEAASGDDVLEAHHAPHKPHWRGLSSGARRLLSAQERLEESIED
jgi:hypothetical protein